MAKDEDEGEGKEIAWMVDEERSETGKVCQGNPTGCRPHSRLGFEGETRDAKSRR